MLTEDSRSIIITALTGLLSGLVVAAVAVLNFLNTSKKTKAEIEKLQVETQKLRLDLTKNVDNLASVSYSLSKVTENVVYNSTQGDGFDFEGVEGDIWIWNEAKQEWAKTLTGRGVLKVEAGGLLNVQRTNTEGRYEVWLRRYLYKGTEKAFLPKDELLAGQRKLRVTCEAKAVDSEHTLRFVIKDNNPKNETLAKKDIRISGNDWTPLEVHFLISPSIDCRLRIDDKDVSRAPSSVQIRNLLLAEKRTVQG